MVDLSVLGGGGGLGERVWGFFPPSHPTITSEETGLCLGRGSCLGLASATLSPSACGRAKMIMGSGHRRAEPWPQSPSVKQPDADRASFPPFLFYFLADRPGGRIIEQLSSATIQW